LGLREQQKTKTSRSLALKFPVPTQKKGKKNCRIAQKSEKIGGRLKRGEA